MGFFFSHFLNYHVFLFYTLKLNPFFFFFFFGSRPMSSINYFLYKDSKGKRPKIIEFKNQGVQFFLFDVGHQVKFCFNYTRKSLRGHYYMCSNK